MMTLLHAGLLAMLQLSDTSRVFPPMQGQNLDGRTLEMPQDFAGELNVVFIAFKREQQADVDSWGPRSIHFGSDTLASASTSFRHSGGATVSSAP